MQPWQAPVPYGPPSRADRRIVAGAATAFVGFLLQGIGWILLLVSFGIGSNPFAFLLLGIGSILAGVGFLVAFLGLAYRRPG